MKRIFALVIFMLAVVSCSGADQAYPVKPGNEAFALGNSTEIGVLLAHGFESSPNELRELAEYLAAENISVYAVRLKGHGTDIRELDNAKWQDWYNDYEKGYNELSKKAEKVFVAGHSLGGALALYLAGQKDTAGVISLASPVGLKDKRAEYAWLIRYFRKYEPRSIGEAEKAYHYDRYSASAVEQLVLFIDEYKKRLPEVTEPLLAIQLSNDTKIEPQSAYYIYSSTSSKSKKMLIINATGHSLLEGSHKDGVYKEVLGFIVNSSLN